MDIKLYHVTPFKESLITIITEKQFRFITGFLGMTVGISIVIVYHSYRKRKQREVIKNIDRGGDEFKDLIDPRLMYEVKDESLATEIIKMVNFTPGNTQLVIDARIAIKAVLGIEEYVNSKVAYKIGFSFLARKLLEMTTKVNSNLIAKNLLALTGMFLSENQLRVVAPTMEVTRFALNGILPFTVGVGGAVGGYALLVPLLIANPTFPVALLLSALLSFGGFTLTNSGMANYFDRIDRSVFNELVRTIPPIIINNDETDTSFLIPEPTEESTGIYIRSEQGDKKFLPADVDVTIDAEFEILMNSDSGDKVQPICSISEQPKSMFSRSSKEKVVECEARKTKVVPLKFRTKTWNDLVKEGAEKDTTETEELFSAYNRKSNEFRQRREKIMAKRNLNKDIHELNVNNDKQTSTLGYRSIEELEKDMNEWE
uniref:hypothetical protein n=1 Tax=Nitzschia ovalis TaxID=908985 RepID=UPI001EF9F999|nr:hypothetical protein MKT70_pgp042 [Nitzschia ovalis]ULD15757.1 hypothetical protein [Nitzschia ovalis]